MYSIIWYCRILNGCLFKFHFCEKSIQMAKYANSVDLPRPQNTIFIFSPRMNYSNKQRRDLSILQVKTAIWAEKDGRRCHPYRNEMVFNVCRQVAMAFRAKLTLALYRWDSFFSAIKLTCFQKSLILSFSNY